MQPTPGERLNAVRSELSQLEHYRRRTYQGVLFLIAIILCVNWWAGEATDQFTRFTYPVFVPSLLFLCVVMGYPSIPLEKLDVSFVMVVGAVILSRLSWYFVTGDPLGDDLLLLTGGHYWAVAILIVGSFISLGYRRGLVAGLVVFGFSAMLAAYEFSACLISETAACGNGIYLLRAHLFLAVLLALTATGTHLREKTLGAFARAEMLELRAETDPLSGLANRRGANRFLSKEAALADRYKRSLTIILIDVDHFKTINDVHGHEVGDRVICEFARIISDTVREVDLAARWGGDEFLIAAPGIDKQGAWFAAERCRQAVLASDISGVRLTMSIGIAEYEPGMSINDAISRADVMLYRAKAAGRNCVKVEQEEQLA